MVSCEIAMSTVTAADYNRSPSLIEKNNMALLNYTREGSGFPLVLQHGYFGSAEHWRTQIDYFKDRFDIIAPNLAGMGDSAELTAPESIPECAQKVFDLLDSLGIDKFHLLGHSMGGMTVQQMAIMQPDRIKKLICYGTGPVGVLPNRFETLDQSRQRVLTDGVHTAGKRIAATWFVDGEEAEGFAVCEHISKYTTEQAALACLTAWGKWNVVDSLDRITCPTLILWGDRDRSYGWSQPEALWHGISDSYLAVVPGCAHATHMEKPALFNALLDDFLADY